MKVSKRAGRTRAEFFRRTVSAQLHAVGFVLMLVGGFGLLRRADSLGDAHVWACLSFVIAGALLFGTSSTYHFLHDGYQVSARLEAFLENLDHYCIFLFIAGTYSPVILNATEGVWRTRLLVAIWTEAVLGIVYTSFKPRLYRWMQNKLVYTGIFLLMGWTFVVRAHEIFSHLSSIQVGFFAGGVLAYSLGALSYVTQRPALFRGYFGYHEVWHTMVLAGATQHFLLILSFYARA